MCTTVVQKKTLLRKTFVMKKEKNTPISAVVSHENVQHSGSELCVQHCICYHIYLKPYNYDLPDSIPVAYGDITALGSVRVAVLLQRGLDSRGPIRMEMR